jgi:energy-coupling factor transporter transmembrane protein EcfT
MSGNLLACAKDCLNLIKDWVSANLLTILLFMTIGFIGSYILFIFSKGMSFILRYTIKWTNRFFKGLGILTIILLLIVILRAIFCLVFHERYAAICPPPVAVACQKGCVKDPKLESKKDKMKESPKSGKGSHSKDSKETEKKKKDP